MWLLFALAGLILISAAFLNTKTKIGSLIYIGIVFSVFAFLMMFKGQDVGNDTRAYIALFNEIKRYTDVNFFLKFTRYEKGFVYLNRIISMYTNDAHFLFIVTGPIIAFSFARFIYKYSKMPWLSAYMFLTLQFFDLSLSGIRQILSISILLFSYDFIIKKKIVPFVLLVFLATSIHTSAMAFVLLYVLSHFKQTKKFYAISSIVAVVMFVFFSVVMKLMEIVLPQYLKYFTDEGTSFKSSPTLACALMIVLWLTMLLISEFSKNDGIFNKIETRDIEDRQTFIIKKSTVDDVLRLSIWLGIIMLFLSLNGTILNRFKYVFTVPIIAYYPNALAEIKLTQNKVFLIIGSCIVFLAYILIIYIYRPEWQSTYPYIFHWQEGVTVL